MIESMKKLKETLDSEASLRIIYFKKKEVTSRAKFTFQEALKLMKEVE